MTNSQVPQTQWYQFIDRFTSIDELLREILKALQRQPTGVPQPPGVPGPPQILPPALPVPLPIKHLGTKNSTFDVITTGSTATTIVGKNDDRIALLLQNQTAVDTFLGPDNSVSASKYGVRLQQFDSYEINQNNLYKGDVFAVTGSGSTTVSFWEFFE